MFDKSVAREAKEFGLLLAFMFICGTVGTIIFSKLVFLLSRFSFLGGTFLFFIFLLTISGFAWGIYRIFRKTLPFFHHCIDTITAFIKKMQNL